VFAYDRLHTVVVLSVAQNTSDNIRCNCNLPDMSLNRRNGGELTNADLNDYEKLQQCSNGYRYVV